MEFLESFLYNVLFIIFLFQVVILVAILFVLLLSKLYFGYRNWINRRRKKKIEEELLRCLFQNEKFTDKWPFRSYREKKVLLVTLEEFARRLKGESWKTLVYDIAERYLIASARGWSSDRSRVKRNFSIRQFILTPYREDYPTVLKLLDDEEFLVAGAAAQFVVAEEYREGIVKLLHNMAHLEGYHYSYYRDLLLASSHIVHCWIEEVAVEEKEENELHRVSLDILEHAFFQLSKINLDSELHSEDKKLQKAALTLLSHNPQTNGEALLIEELDEKNPRLRREAIAGLEYYPSKLSLKKLERALSDIDITVRLKAATTLKHLGRDGIKILMGQDPIKDKEAHEIAEYVLMFDR